jgi:diguanylate cyclase (GGDEF)-like protein
MQVRNHLGGMSILYFDICQFANINHAYGHRWGDELLTLVAERLTRLKEYGMTAYRVGGDQFAVLSRSNRPRDAMDYARRVRDAVRQPYSLDREEVEVEFAFGLAFCGEPEKCVDKVLSQAAIAHMRAKKMKDSSIVMYDARIHQSFLRNLFLGKAIPQGVSSGEFYLEFQPVIDIGAEKFYGMEALLRWNSSNHGMISPGEFIPIAEENNQIALLGEFALEQACLFWKGSGFIEEDLILSVNVSGKQFAQQGFFGRLKNVLDRTGMPPRSLKLEVTETALMENARDTVPKLQNLRNLGVQISIDDFGTGYSSLDYLRQFSADTMKIDMSFVQKMEKDGKSYELVRAMIDLARTFEMTVIAEGVETAEQSRLLQELGCCVHQGFYYSHPLSPEDAPEFFKNSLLSAKASSFARILRADF